MNGVCVVNIDIEDRKQQLIAQAAACRSGVGKAQQQVRDSLQLKSLAGKAVGPLVLGAFAVATSKKGGLVANRVQTLLPLIVSGMSMLSKKISFKPKLRTAAAIGVVATIAAVLAKRKFSQGCTTPQHSRRA
jgi:hypothetical protein